MQINTVLVNYINLLIVSVLCTKSYAKTFRSESELIGAFMNTLKLQSTLFGNVITDQDVHQFAEGRKLEEVHLDIEDLIKKNGYAVNTYDVVTEDGYILKLFRIPSSGRPILLMHGLLMSADDWVVAGSESSIAFLLAAEGFDVWLGNTRGGKHSRRHINLSPDSAQFWDFSWDEMGRYDLPAMIDFVLSTTCESQLVYVGHSQGTTAYYVMGSERPEYNAKVIFMVGLAAVAAIPNLKSPLLLFLKYASLERPDLLFKLLRRVGWNEISGNDGIVQSFFTAVCGNKLLASDICRNVLLMMAGFGYAQLNMTNLPVVLAHTPSGSSFKQIEHYAQTEVSGKFRKFDHGILKNVLVYGSSKSPEYNVSAITTPLAIFYAANDWLASEPDTHILRSHLKNVVDFYKIPVEDFHHVDFIYTKNMKTLIFQRLLRLINVYNSI